MMRRVTTEWRLAQADGMDLPAPDACKEADDEGASALSHTQGRARERRSRQQPVDFGTGGNQRAARARRSLSYPRQPGTAPTT